MAEVCSDCNGRGFKPCFIPEIGAFTGRCDCSDVCPTCEGTGRGEPGFADGIGAYPTDCKICGGGKVIPKIVPFAKESLPRLVDESFTCQCGSGACVTQNGICIECGKSVD